MSTPDGQFVQSIHDLTRKPWVENVDGRQRLVLPPGWTEVSPPPFPSPQTLKVNTLTGFVDAIMKKVDAAGGAVDLTKAFVHVKAPDEVLLRSALEGEEMLFRRQALLVATTEMVGPHPIMWANFMDHQMFLIALQCGFAPTEDLRKVLEVLSSIRDSDVTEYSDDGLKQQVNIARGLHLKDNALIPNPVVLAPYRTFREVDQPKSTFVLRLQKVDGQRPRCALFEAEGGAWKLEAITKIADFLAGKLAGAVPVIA